MPLLIPERNIRASAKTQSGGARSREKLSDPELMLCMLSLSLRNSSKSRRHVSERTHRTVLASARVVFRRAKYVYICANMPTQPEKSRRKTDAGGTNMKRTPVECMHMYSMHMRASK